MHIRQMASCSRLWQAGRELWGWVGGCMGNNGPGAAGLNTSHTRPTRCLNSVCNALCTLPLEASVIKPESAARPPPTLAAGIPGEGKRAVWVLARQHPGESMAEWFAEGLLRRLLDRHDAVARKLLQEAVFYVVVSHDVLFSIWNQGRGGMLPKLLHLREAVFYVVVSRALSVLGSLSQGRVYLEFLLQQE